METKIHNVSEQDCLLNFEDAYYILSTSPFWNRNDLREKLQAINELIASVNNQ